jgi:hypothetical protein
VIPAAVANSWFFWLAIIGVVAGVYILPTVIAIARQVEGLGWFICLNMIPDPGWQRIDADQVQVVEIDGCLAVDAGVGRRESVPRGDLARSSTCGSRPRKTR